MTRQGRCDCPFSASAQTGMSRLISMSQYFKRWEQGLLEPRKQLKTADDLEHVSTAGKKILKERIQAAGLATDQSNSMPLTGRGRPALVVFDPAR